MESLSAEMSNECLVTDLVNELSSGLEIPFLLREDISLLDKQDETLYNDAFKEKNLLSDVLNSELYEDKINPCIKNQNNYYMKFHYQNGSINIHSMNNLLESSNDNKSNSSSECSSIETWMIKNELDTPPITPPDEKNSADNNFFISSEDLPFISITHSDELESLDVVANNVSNTIDIQQKSSNGLGIFADSQNLKSPTVDLHSAVFLNVFDKMKSTSFKSSSNSNVLLTSNQEKKAAVLSKKDLEFQAKKKQERMIRNRESAYLSRKRKKEYVAYLEKQVKDLVEENNNLRLENYSLRQKLANYEEINVLPDKKTKSIFGNSPKKTTALFALFFTLCFNFGTFSSFMSELRWTENGVSESNIFEIQSNKLKHTRSLLWTDSDLKSINTTFENLTASSCPAFVNQSESIRLESELRKWIKGENDFSGSYNHNISKLNQNLSVKKIPQLLKDTSKIKKRKKSFISSKKGYFKMDMFKVKPYFFNFDTFFEAIHRRDDTFYLVSFSGNHLLLPALSHNKTSRPKISLMLPGLLSNVTGPVPDQVEMMQIDCEITNTQILNVNENDISFNIKSFSNFTPKIKENFEQKMEKYEEFLLNNEDNLLSVKPSSLQSNTYSESKKFTSKSIKKSEPKFALAKFIKYQSSDFTFNSVFNNTLFKKNYSRKFNRYKILGNQTKRNQDNNSEKDILKMQIVNSNLPNSTTGVMNVSKEDKSRNLPILAIKSIFN